MDEAPGEIESTNDLVVLLDAAHRPVDVAPKDQIHHGSTPLHLAFSCYLFHHRTGQILVTRRALTKRTWPGVWSNSCCGHPRPSERLIDAALRRTREELGLAPTGLAVVIPRFSYRAVDHSGIVENEVCPVLVGTVDAEPDPDPAEVCAWSWTTWSDLRRIAAHTPWAISPWAARQVPVLRPHLPTGLAATSR